MRPQYEIERAIRELLIEWAKEADPSLTDEDTDIPPNPKHMPISRKLYLGLKERGMLAD